MATALPVEIFEILEDKLGREQAHEIVKAMEYAAGDIARQKKAELREDLTKELAGKADLLAVKAELQGEIKLLRSDLQSSIKIYFIITIAVIVLTNPRALDLVSRLLGIVK